MFTQKTANFISAIIATWMGLVASGAIPDGSTAHWVSVAMSGVSLFMVHMGFNRTPSGTILPEGIKKLVDNTKDD